MTHFNGTSGDDVIEGTRRKDVFNMSQGGNDTVHGNGGPDRIVFGAAFTADDSIDGGVKGHDGPQATVELNGDYSAGVVFGAATMTHIGMLLLGGGHSYNLTFNQTTVVSGWGMAVDASKLTQSDSLVLDDSASGQVRVVCNAGHVSFIGGTDLDTLDLGKALNASDRIDGGGNFNTLLLRAGSQNHLVLDNSWISNVGLTVMSSGQIYDFATADDFVAAGKNAWFLGGNDNNVIRSLTFTFDGSAETDGTFRFEQMTGTVSIVSGAGNDVFNTVIGNMDGGAGNDIFQLCTGTIQGGDGDDEFYNCNGTIYAGTGNATVGGGAGTFHLENAGLVIVQNAPASAFFMGASFDQADNIFNAGQLVLDGDYSGGLTLGNIVNVPALKLMAGHSYALTATDNTVAAKATMTIDGSALGAGDSLHFDASAESDGSFAMTGGAGDDILIGGNKPNTLTGGQGQDVLTGGMGKDTLQGGGAKDVLDGGAGGNDQFVYGALTESTGIHFDTVVGFDVFRDAFDFLTHVLGVDAHVFGGTLDDTGSGALFNQELGAAVDAAHLAAHHAVLFTPDGGSLAGHLLLIVDANGTAGYQAGADFVIEMNGGNGVESLNTGNFH